MLVKHIISEQVVQEITRPDTQKEATAYLRKHGYQQLGSGYYATVMGKEGTPHVLKIFDNTDKGYLEFVALAIATKNPHFPQFRGKPMRITKDYYGIRLERLKPFTGTASETYGFEFGYQLLGILSRVMVNAKNGVSGDMLTYNDFEEMAGYYEEIPFSNIPLELKGMSPVEIAEYKYDELYEKHPELLQAAWLVGKHVDPSRSIDLHLGNVMLRGDTLVITDPVSFGNYK